MKAYLITLAIAQPVTILAAGFDMASATVATALYIELIAVVGAASVVSIETAQRTGS